MWSALVNVLNHDLPQTPAPICLLPQSHSCRVASVPRQCGASSSSRGWVRPGCRSYQPPHPPPWNPSCLHATSMSARVQLQAHAYFRTLLLLSFIYKCLYYRYNENKLQKSNTCNVQGTKITMMYLYKLNPKINHGEN